MKRFQRRLLYKYYKFKLLYYVFKKDHDYDFHYLMLLIYQKLTNMALVIRKEEITCGDKKIAHEIWTARKILKRVVDDNYGDKRREFIHRKMVEKFGYYIQSKARFTDDGGKYKLMKWDYLPVYTHFGIDLVVDDSANKPANIEEAIKWYNFFQKFEWSAYKDAEKDFTLFCQYLAKHIWNWSD